MVGIILFKILDKEMAEYKIFSLQFANFIRRGVDNELFCPYN